MPAATFAAPQTTWCVCSPSNTSQTRSFSASGWGFTARTSATTTPLQSPPTGSTPSTSSPAIVIWATSSWVSRAGFTHSRNHCSLTFMLFLLLNSGGGSALSATGGPSPPLRYHGHLTAAGLLELIQKTQIVLEEHPQIIHAIAQHSQTLHPQTEREAVINFRIDSTGFKHLGMNHAAAHHFQPADIALLVTPPFDIHFSRRLGKGKIRGTKPHFQITLKEHLQKLNNGALQVGKTDFFIHQQTFHLVEHRGMGLIRVTAVHPPWPNHAKRRLTLLHSTNLYRIGVSPQQPAGVEIKGIMHRPGRVM